MSLTAYCSYDEVRSALGVNDTELKDSVLALPVYEMGLVRELNKLSTSLNAAFSTVRLKAPGSRSATEAALFDAVRLFSVYACAKQACVGLANFAPKDVGDGKASISRFAGVPYEVVMERVEGMYTSTRVELKAVYDTFLGAAQAVVTAPVFAVGSQRGYDPVTGA